jgi:secretion/DNA translocation related TadE-like protein
VLVLVVVMLVLALAGWALVGSLAAGVRQRAGAVADLAALAAAAESARGPESACRTAATVAVANGARLDACTLDSVGVADIVVAVEVHGAFASSGPALGRARAGPAP